MHTMVTAATVHRALHRPRCHSASPLVAVKFDGLAPSTSPGMGDLPDLMNGEGRHVPQIRPGSATTTLPF
jgi:hypothetical protein